MKKLILLTFTLFLAVIAQAQIKEVVFTTEPQIDCQHCVKTIKENLRFEKGVKAINPDLSTKLVTIQYDSEKTNPEKLIKAFAKIKYKATVVEPEEKQAVEADEKSSKNNQSDRDKNR